MDAAVKPTEIEVREATADDLDAIVRLGAKFAAVTQQVTGMGAEYDPDGVRQKLQTMIDWEDGVVFVAVMNEYIAGIAAGMIYDVWFTKGHRTMQELFWFVHPDFRGYRLGKDMMDALELWARLAGCDSVAMMNLNHLDPKPADMYKANGYRPMENHYVKELN